MKDRPDIVFICLDQLAAQAVGPYGNNIVKTPNIDRLAKQGVCFDNFWCNSPLCGPARFSLFTGHMPFPNLMAGAECIGYPYIEYMGDYFHNAGYLTFSAGKLHGVPKTFDFGFRHCRINDLALNQRITENSYSSWLYDKVNDRNDSDKQRKEIDLHYRSYWYNVDRTLLEHYFLPNELSENSWIREEAELFIKNSSNENRPLFMHIGINHPHGAWFAKPMADEVVSPDEVILPDTFETHWRTKPIPSNAHKEVFMMENITEKWTERDWRIWLAKYYTSVNHADKVIGNIIDLIKEYGDIDNTIFILTTDHGDMLGQYRLEAKYFFYNGSARIPLIMSGRGIPQNERREQLCEQIDIIPTLLELGGIENDYRLEGVSLKTALLYPLIKSKEQVHGWIDFRGRQMTMTLTSDNYKLCTFDQGYHTTAPQNYYLGHATELYDLNTDPDERNNIFGEIKGERIEKLVFDHFDYFNKYSINLGWILSNEKDKSCSPPVLRSCVKQMPPVASSFDLEDELGIKK